MDTPWSWTVRDPDFKLRREPTAVGSLAPDAPAVATDVLADLSERYAKLIADSRSSLDTMVFSGNWSSGVAQLNNARPLAIPQRLAVEIHDEMHSTAPRLYFEDPDDPADPHPSSVRVPNLSGAGGHVLAVPVEHDCEPWDGYLDAVRAGREIGGIDVQRHASFDARFEALHRIVADSGIEVRQSDPSAAYTVLSPGEAVVVPGQAGNLRAEAASRRVYGVALAEGMRLAPESSDPGRREIVAHLAAAWTADTATNAVGLGRWSPMPDSQRAGAVVAMTREPGVLADAMAVGARLEERLLQRPDRGRERLSDPPAPHTDARPAAVVVTDASVADRFYR